MCVSTVDEHGLPDGRFVDLKEVSGDGFVFGTHLDSRKSHALDLNPSVALTFWWDHIERQVRVVGRAQRVSDVEADALFSARSRDAQITSSGSQQSAPLQDPVQLEQRLSALRRRFTDMAVPRPDRWGGYRVIPSRMEFLTFLATRMHERVLFQRGVQGWERSLLQP